MNYYIIIPAHNEQQFIGATLTSIVNQTLQPQKVIIVNDHSTDDTEAIIDKFIASNSNFNKLNILSSKEHMPGSKVVNAFTCGLELLDDHYDFIVKLDADIIVPENYFEKIAAIFKAHQKVGIAGGLLYEKNLQGIWEVNHPMKKNHVRGAIKSYSKQCFAAIKGLRNAMGWDTVDELLAQFHGFESFTDANLQVQHLRPTGDAYNKKAKLLQGKAMYTMRYGLAITLIASLKMAWKQQKLQAFFDNMTGFFHAKKDKLDFLVSPMQGRFIRNLRWKGIKNSFLKLL